MTVTPTPRRRLALRLAAVHLGVAAVWVSLPPPLPRDLAVAHAAADGRTVAPRGGMMWRHRTPGGVVPAGRKEATLSFDAKRDRFLFFGGHDASADRNDVWSLTFPETGPARWRRIEAAGKPPPGRSGHVAVVDEANDRLLVYGGWEHTRSRSFGDLWSLDLSDGEEKWELLAPVATGPGPRRGAGAFYDEGRRRMVLFGGYDGLLGWNDAWSLDLAVGAAPRWRALAPAGTPPVARDSFAYAHDAAGDRFIVYGGFNRWRQQLLSDLHFLDLSPGHEAWVSATDRRPEPPGRMSAGSVVDPIDGRLVVYGGWNSSEYLDDVWSFDLGMARTGWQRMHPTGGGPGRRSGHATAYDPAAGRLVVVGGYVPEFKWLSDVWTLDLGSEVPTPTPTPTATATATLTPTATRTPGLETPMPTATAIPRGRAFLPRLVYAPLPTATATVTPEPCTTDEIEPNDSLSQADANLALCVDRSLEGRLPPGDDDDLYHIEVTRPATVDIDLWNLPPGTDYDLYLYDRAGTIVAQSQQFDTDPEHITVDVAPARYYIRVHPDQRRSPQAYLLRWFAR